jgi:hypothetical protein
MGDALYLQGNDAFRDNEGVRRAPGVNEATHWAVLLLSSGAHGFWRLALPSALLVLVALCAALIVLGRTPLAAVGAGAGFAAVASLAVWFLAGALNEASTAALDREIALILRDGAWIGVRNALAVASSALGLMILFRTIEGARLRARPMSSSPPQEIPPV